MLFQLGSLLINWYYILLPVAALMSMTLSDYVGATLFLCSKKDPPTQHYSSAFARFGSDSEVLARYMDRLSTT